MLARIDVVVRAAQAHATDANQHLTRVACGRDSLRDLERERFFADDHLHLDHSVGCCTVRPSLAQIKVTLPNGSHFLWFSGECDIAGCAWRERLLELTPAEIILDPSCLERQSDSAGLVQYFYS